MDWIDVKERLPAQEQRAIVSMACGAISMTTWHDGEFIMPSSAQPTHWMPLPPPPEKVEPKFLTTLGEYMETYGVQVEMPQPSVDAADAVRKLLGA